MSSVPPDPPRLSGGDDAVATALRAARADIPARAELAGLTDRLAPLFVLGDLPLDVPPEAPPPSLPPLTPPALPPPALPPVPLAPLFSAKIAAIVVAASVAVGAPLAYQMDRSPPPRPAPAVSATRLASSASPTAVTSGRGPTDAPPDSPVDSPASSAKEARSAQSPAPRWIMGNEPAPPESTSPAETEAQLLRRAHDALGADPARALALAEEHARAFPRAVLGQERELVAIDALSRLGRGSEARDRAERFLQRFPTSPHARRLQTLVPGLTPPTPP